MKTREDDEAAEMERIMELSKQEVDDEAFQRQREEEQLRARAAALRQM